MGFLITVFIVFNLNFWVGVAVLAHLDKNCRLPVWYGVREYVKAAIFWPLVYREYS